MEKIDIHDNFSKRVEELREKAGLTIKDLCKHLEISPQAYNNYIHGKQDPGTGEYNKRVPSVNKSIEICEYFGVSLDYLYGRDDCTSVENEYIHEVTGLSDKALKRIKRIKKGSPEAIFAINKLLEYSHRPALDRIGAFFNYGNANLEGIVKILPSSDNKPDESTHYDMSLDSEFDYELYIYDKDNNYFPVSIDMALFEDIKDQLKDIRDSIRKETDF